MRLHKRRMYAYVSTYARKALYLIKKRRYQRSRISNSYIFLLKNRLKWILVFIHSCQMWKCRCMCFELRNCNKLFCSFISIAIDRVQSTYVKMYAEAPIQTMYCRLSLSTQCPKILEWWNHCRRFSLVDSSKCWFKVLTNQFYGTTCQYFARPSENTCTYTNTLHICSKCKHSAKLYFY